MLGRPAIPCCLDEVRGVREKQQWPGIICERVGSLVE